MRLSGLTAKNRHGDGVRFRLVLSFRYFADGVVWTGYRQRGIFNDLARELLAIMLIPGLIRRSRSTALGLCGATSMDFTLPVLQRSGGVEIVPAAIVHGFILSLLVPLLMAFFSA